MSTEAREDRPATAKDPGEPYRRRRLERVAIGGLLGAAAFLGAGKWIQATGGTRVVIFCNPAVAGPFGAILGGLLAATLVRH